MRAWPCIVAISSLVLPACALEPMNDLYSEIKYSREDNTVRSRYSSFARPVVEREQPTRWEEATSSVKDYYQSCVEANSEAYKLNVELITQKKGEVSKWYADFKAGVPRSRRHAIKAFMKFVANLKPAYYQLGEAFLLPALLYSFFWLYPVARKSLPLDYLIPLPSMLWIFRSSAQSRPVEGVSIYSKIVKSVSTASLHGAIINTVYVLYYFACARRYTFAKAMARMGVTKYALSIAALMELAKLALWLVGQGQQAFGSLKALVDDFRTP